LRTPFFLDTKSGHSVIGSRRFEAKQCLHLHGSI